LECFDGIWQEFSQKVLSREDLEETPFQGPFRFGWLFTLSLSPAPFIFPRCCCAFDRVEKFVSAGSSPNASSPHGTWSLVQGAVSFSNPVSPRQFPSRPRF